MAAELKMDYDKNMSLIDQICSSLESSTWPEDTPDTAKNALHKTYNANNILRYKLSKNVWDQQGIKDTSKEEWTSSVQQAGKPAKESVVQLQIQEVQDPSNNVVIKTEESLAQKVKSNLVEAHQLANKLVSLTTEFRKLKAKMNQLGTADSSSPACVSKYASLIV